MCVCVFGKLYWVSVAHSLPAFITFYSSSLSCSNSNSKYELNGLKMIICFWEHRCMLMNLFYCYFVCLLSQRQSSHCGDDGFLVASSHTNTMRYLYSACLCEGDTWPNCSSVSAAQEEHTAAHHILLSTNIIRIYSKFEYLIILIQLQKFILSSQKSHELKQNYW